MKIGVSFALLQGQLLAGEISRRSAFLERASPLATGTSEAAAVGDKALAIAANHAIDGLFCPQQPKLVPKLPEGVFVSHQGNLNFVTIPNLWLTDEDIPERASSRAETRG